MEIRKLLEQVREGTMTLEEAELFLSRLPYEELDFAKLDHHRASRRGCAEIFARFYEADENILGTRAQPEHFQAIQQRLPQASYSPEAKVVSLCPHPMKQQGCVAVCTAGTSDIPVAEEAALTAEFFGAKTLRIFDVGVAGIHRLFARMEDIHQANAVIACAGMEGALASVIGGLCQVPVIALPTSVGYGSSFGGVSALLTMLNSCAEGVGTVNIDNGFGAGYLAAQINRLAVEGGKA